MVPINAMKAEPREHIEQLAKTHPGLAWIGVVTNPWFDFVYSLAHRTETGTLTTFQSFKGGYFAIDAKNRTATLYDEGSARFNTTMIPTVGLAVARLLSLPVKSSSGPSLSDYANKFIYISSFHTTQREILDAVQKVTNTTDADWIITKASAQEYIDEGSAKIVRGDLSGMMNLIFGTIFKAGLGGDFEAERGGTINEVLGLPKEDMVDVLRGVIDA